MLSLSNNLVTERNVTSFAAESFRSLRTFIRLQGIRQRDQGYVLLLTSACSGEGKTTVLANLAVSFAQDGRKVLIIDANLRQPALQEVFKVANHSGLSSYLIGEYALDEVIHSTGIDNLSLIPAGSNRSNPVELLGGEIMGRLLTDLRQQYDVILVDSPQLIDYSDARVLAATSDGVVLIARYGKSKRASIRKANQLLQQAGANVLGITMNQIH